MFEATLDDIPLLRDSLVAISELIDEAELHVKESGILLVAADRSVVTIVDFYLHRSAFKSYQCDGDARLGLNLLNLLQVVRRAVPGDSLTLRLDGKRLHVVLESSSVRRFTLPLIDVSKEETPDLGKLEAGFSARFVANPDMVFSGIEDAEIIADSIVITARKDQLMLKAEGDSSSAQLEIPAGQHFRVLDMNEPVRARYSLDYLRKIFKGRKLGTQAAIQMSNDYPMKVQFEIPEKIRLGFVLAPRVEEG